MSNISAGTSTTTSLVQTGDLTGNLVLQSNAVSIATVTSTGVLVSGVVSATGNVTSSYFIGNGSELTGVAKAAVVLNDISNQFDNITSVFALRNEQAAVTNIVDSRDLQVVVGGQTLSPYVTLANWPFVGPFFTPYDSYRGFRVKSDSISSNLIIYNSPAIGDQATVTIINNSTTVSTRRYPYSPETIALGD